MRRFKSYIKEDGHEDVASVKKQIKIAKSALEKMDGEMSKLNDSDSLPTWWTNKMAVAANNLNKLRDYLLIDGE